MARVNNSAKSTSKNPSVAEIRKWYTENKANIENYAKAKESFRQLRDTTKTSTRSRHIFPVLLQMKKICVKQQGICITEVMFYLDW